MNYTVNIESLDYKKIIRGQLSVILYNSSALTVDVDKCKMGDVLIINEIVKHNKGGEYMPTGNSTKRIITYVLKDDCRLAKNFSLLNFRRLKDKIPQEVKDDIIKHYLTKPNNTVSAMVKVFKYPKHAINGIIDDYLKTKKSE